MSLKLNLGGGTVRLNGFLTVDLYDPNADVKHDLTKPLPYGENEVDEIFSSHVIEHFSREQWEKMKKDWYRVLKPDGKLEIYCPDIALSAKNLLANLDDKGKRSWWIKTIYGSQNTPGEFHRNGFTPEILKDDLEKEGFRVQVAENAMKDNVHVVATKLDEEYWKDKKTNEIIDMENGN